MIDAAPALRKHEECVDGAVMFNTDGQRDSGKSGRVAVEQGANAVGGEKRAKRNVPAYFEQCRHRLFRRRRSSKVGADRVHEAVRECVCSSGSGEFR